MKVFLYNNWGPPAGYFYVVGQSRTQVEADCEMLGPMLYQGSVPYDIIKFNLDDIPVLSTAHASGLFYKPLATAVNNMFAHDPCASCVARICGKEKEEDDDTED